MNCPSKTDEDVLWHPEWNQSPPRFAADLTTCEDLNGIANARELGEADRLRSGTQSLRRCGIDDSNVQEMEKRPPNTTGEGVKGSLNGPCTRTTRHVSEYQGGLTATIISWSKWLVSVLCTSILISWASGNLSAPRFFCPKINHSNVFPGEVPAKMAKRSPTTIWVCMSLVSSLFSSYPALDVPSQCSYSNSRGCAFHLPSFLGAKHFGTGVLVATAFVHLLPTAFGSLNDPCLSSFWTTDYQAMPGAIMLASVFFVTLIEMIFSPAQHVCGGNEGAEAVSRRKEEPKHETTESPAPPQPAMQRTYSESSMRDTLRYREDGQRLDAIESVGGSAAEIPGAHSKEDNDEYAIEQDQETGDHNHVLTPEQIHKKAIMQVFLLEMGILFHSIFIGMSLAVSVGNDFTVLLIAIVFHQTFEGLALGVRIADINWKPCAAQPWLMALAYGCTTPGGMAIGIATHTLYSPDSEVGLLVVGIMNAISAGFLVYASLVELMSEDFLSDESWKVLRGKRRVYACLLVFLGAFLMSLVGAWA
ncbi:unnamed protein product [Alternaria alternata]